MSLCLLYSTANRAVMMFEIRSEILVCVRAELSRLQSSFMATEPIHSPSPILLLSAPSHRLQVQPRGILPSCAGP